MRINAAIYVNNLFNAYPHIMKIGPKWYNTLHNYEGNNVRIVVNSRILRMACREICKFYATTMFYISQFDNTVIREIINCVTGLFIL